MSSTTLLLIPIFVIAVEEILDGVWNVALLAVRNRNEHSVEWTANIHLYKNSWIFFGVRWTKYSRILIIWNRNITILWSFELSILYIKLKLLNGHTAPDRFHSSSSVLQEWLNARIICVQRATLQLSKCEITHEYIQKTKRDQANLSTECVFVYSIQGNCK